MADGRRFSISTRIAFWFGLSLTMLAVLVSVAVTVGYALVVHHQVDAHLEEAEQQWRPLVAVGENGSHWHVEGQRRLARTDSLAESGTFLRLLSAQGQIRFESRNFAGWPPLGVQLPEWSTTEHVSQLWGPVYVRSRYVSLRDPAGHMQGWMELSRLEYSVHNGIQLYATLLLAGFVLSALVAATAGSLFARRILRPVRQLTKTAGEIGASDLERRLPVDARMRDELTELAETFNAMLSRLEDSFARERRFSAHAAHELKTPLARMRSEVELALRRSGSSAADCEAFAFLLEDVTWMSAMVERLLTLSRVASPGSLQREPVDLSALCEAQLARFRRQAEEEGICLQQQIEPGVTVIAGFLHLGEVLDNLLSNALKYTPAGGCITVALRREPQTVRLVVADTGAGFDAQEAAYLFDGFYRSDAPEVQAQPGSGLGLALVQQIVTAYGGTVEAHSEGKNRGSRFEVAWPSDRSLHR